MDVTLSLKNITDALEDYVKIKNAVRDYYNDIETLRLTTDAIEGDTNYHKNIESVFHHLSKSPSEQIDFQQKEDYTKIKQMIEGENIDCINNVYMKNDIYTIGLAPVIKVMIEKIKEYEQNLHDIVNNAEDILDITRRLK